MIDERTASRILAAMFWGTMLCGLCVFILSMVGTTRYYDEVQQITPIASISDGNTIHGGSFLFSGYISENPNFYFYTQDCSIPSCIYRLQHVDARYATIIMDENVSPYMATLVPMSQFTPQFESLTWSGAKRPTRDFKRWEMYEFHIPAGSIVRDFNLDTNMRT